MGSASDQSKKPCTVHIDVYCTDTSKDSDLSSSSEESSEDRPVSTPHTLFKSEKVRVTHEGAYEHFLPLIIGNEGLKKVENVFLVKRNDSLDNDEEDSTSYPSNLGSYSTIKDFSSSLSSVPPSCMSYSLSSCTVPEISGSVSNKSLNDSFSVIDSLVYSSSRIPHAGCLDPVTRRLCCNKSNIYTSDLPLKTLLQTSTYKNLEHKDSFEYDNSEDKLRINKMEDLLIDEISDELCPQVNNKLFLQQKKIKKKLEKGQSDPSLLKCESRHADSECRDEFQKSSIIAAEDNKKDSFKIYNLLSSQNSPTRQLEEHDLIHKQSMRSPSEISLQQRLQLDPTLRAPFSVVPGIYTDQRAIAKRFGSILTAVRKPGHHVGPAKNSDCLCDHCQRHFENVGYRTRARSMGNSSSYPKKNWQHLS